MSVYAAGHGGPIDVNDLGLKKKYSAANAGRVGPAYTDAALEVRSCSLISDFKSLLNHLDFRNSRYAIQISPLSTVSPVRFHPTSREISTGRCNHSCRLSR